MGVTAVGGFQWLWLCTLNLLSGGLSSDMLFCDDCGRSNDTRLVRQHSTRFIQT